MAPSVDRPVWCQPQTLHGVAAHPRLHLPPPESRAEVGVDQKRRLACQPKPTHAFTRGRRLERETGFEPATSTLARSHSTTELFPPATEHQAYHRARKPGKARGWLRAPVAVSDFALESGPVRPVSLAPAEAGHYEAPRHFFVDAVAFE